MSDVAQSCGACSDGPADLSMPDPDMTPVDRVEFADPDPAPEGESSQGAAEASGVALGSQEPPLPPPWRLRCA
eukprot:13069744-Alexandrium_andersonii.AAC.1